MEQDVTCWLAVFLSALSAPSVFLHLINHDKNVPVFCNRVAAGDLVLGKGKERNGYNLKNEMGGLKNDKWKNSAGRR